MSQKRRVASAITMAKPISKRYKRLVRAGGEYMAKLFFYYSAMNAGKTTTMLQSSYNYLERGMETLLFIPKVDTRYKEGVIKSRIGLESPAYPFDGTFNFFKAIESFKAEKPKLACVLIDEAQFLSAAQVRQLCDVVDQLRLPVLTYGLRTDFLGRTFEGSQHLLALAEELVEIKTICHCGRKATMSARIDAHGKRIQEGRQIDIGGNERYIALCRRHFWQA